MFRVKIETTIPAINHRPCKIFSHRKEEEHQRSEGEKRRERGRGGERERERVKRVGYLVANEYCPKSRIGASAHQLSLVVQSCCSFTLALWRVEGER